MKTQKLKKKLILKFGKFIRERDSDESGFICISCGLWKPLNQLQAGHYYKAGVENLRFHEDNVNGECESCNCFDNNHLNGYRENLIKKIGLGRVEQLDVMAENYRKYGYKWNRFEILEMLTKYK